MKFNTRERNVIVVGCAMFVCILIFPQIQKIQKMHADSIEHIQNSELQLENTKLDRMIIQSERTGHQALQRKLQDRINGFDLYSFVQATLKTHTLQERSTIQNTGRSNAGLEAVEVQLNGVSMNELTEFLHALYESENLVAMNRLTSLRPASGGKGLYCLMQLHSPKS